MKEMYFSLLCLCFALSGCGSNDSSGNLGDTENLTIDTATQTAGNTDTATQTADDSDTGTGQPAVTGLWLHTSGNSILKSDGTPFRGRGANIHDTRSCWACAYGEPNVEEVKRRIDALVDDWGANFMRLCLENYGTAQDEWQVQYANMVEDEAYMQDIIEMVEHIGTKSGVYVLVSLWVEPTTTDIGWPTVATNAIWEVLAARLLAYPHVMFGLVNEPESNSSGAQDADVWEAMNSAVAAIRQVEAANGSPKHIIAVQGTRSWARHLGYYSTHPITAGAGENIAYETHSYLAPNEFEENWIGPSASLPVIIGEFGPSEWNGQPIMTTADTITMMDEAEKRDISWLAWTFHMNCAPNLLVDNSGDSNCGVGMALEPTDWGTVIKNRLAAPWVTQ